MAMSQFTPRPPTPLLLQLLLGWLPTDADPAGLDEDEAPLELLAAASHELDNGLREIPSYSCGEPEKDHTRCRSPVGIYQLPKVLILGEQDTILTNRYVQDRWVLELGRDFHNRYDVMAGGTQGANHGEVTALIGQKPHRLALGVLWRRLDQDRLFVGQRVSRIADGRLNVLAGQAGIGIEQVGFCGPLAEFAQDQLDRDPGSPDHWLS